MREMDARMLRAISRQQAANSSSLRIGGCARPAATARISSAEASGSQSVTMLFSAARSCSPISWRAIAEASRTRQRESAAAVLIAASAPRRRGRGRPGAVERTQGATGRRQ